MSVDRSAAGLAALFEQFESQRLPREAWTHEAHVLVGLWCVLHDPDPLPHMRAGILRLNAAHGVQTTLEGGYHETLTCFFVHCLRSFVAQQREHRGDGVTAEQLAARALALLTRDLPLSYYSRQRLYSAEARFGWCEPDLAPLPRAVVAIDGGGLVFAPLKGRVY